MLKYKWRSNQLSPRQKAEQEKRRKSAEQLQEQKRNSKLWDDDYLRERNKKASYSYAKHRRIRLIK